jgi:hypothetical protein
MSSGFFNSSELPPKVPLLRKPFSSEDLLSAVRAALARSDGLKAELTGLLEERAELRQQRAEILSQSVEARSISSDMIWRAQEERRRRAPDEQPPDLPVSQKEDS